MRVVIYGVGAIGGVVAAGLTLAGNEVVGIARGAQLQAIRSDGLRLRAPETDAVARFDCFGTPAEIGFCPDDAILLCMKTQHTVAALEDLRAAGVRDQPIFCLQNGVENERMAARLFPEVHGVTVMLPASYLEPGKVIAHGAPKFGIFDIGRFSGGVDDADRALAAMLNDSNFAADLQDNVMASKYGKLILNLNNILNAALGAGVDTSALRPLVADEGKRVLDAAGIVWRDVGLNDPRRTSFMKIAEVPGEVGQASSTLQSLKRGTGSVETDYLNGEIALLGRLCGVPTPLNAYLTELGARMARDGLAPGAITEAEIRRAMG